MKKIFIVLLILFLTTMITIKPVFADEIEIGDYVTQEREETNKRDNDIYFYLKILFISMIGGSALLLVLSSFNSKKDNSPIKEQKPDLTKLDPNIDELELKEKIFKLYKDVQSARTKNRLKLLNPLVTEELYQKLEKEINELKKAKEKIVITDILNKETKIIAIEEKNDHKYIYVYLHVNQYDYQIDKDKKVKTGTNDSKYQVEYKLKIEYLNNELKLNNMECTGKWISKS